MLGGRKFIASALCARHRPAKMVNMTKQRDIVPVVSKRRLHEKQSDLPYWQTQPVSARMAALEQIRWEFHQWRYGAQPGFQRVYTIVKRK
jgi:hypothetical protein